MPARNAPNYALGFTLAPCAGAMSACIVATLWSIVVLRPENTGILSMLLFGVLVGIYALPIAAIWTALMGGAIAAYVRFAHRVPRRVTVIILGVATGFLPFAGCGAMSYHTSSGWDFSGDDLGDVLYYPVAALAASIAAAWCFWALSLRDRAVAPRGSGSHMTRDPSG